MNKQFFALGLVLGTAGLAACSGSDDASENQSAQALSYPDGTPHPMTSWGDPDLQGTWPIMHLLSTGLQRNPEFGERLYLTEEEYQASLSPENRASQAARDAAYERMVQTNTLGMGGWAESTTRSPQTRQTSLISYPNDGRFPELTERGEALRSEFGSSWSVQTAGTGFDSPQDDFDTWDRCITRGMPNSMLPFNYNNGIRILQSPGYVIIDLEMIHESRIVPVDGRPGLEPELTQWMGDSRGHWDGATLVVETTNFNGEVGMTNVVTPGSPAGDTPSTTRMKTTERFTRVSDTEIQYEMTIEDPEVLTDQWTVTYPMFMDPEYQFYEYACHEDNTAVRNFIETSRYERGLTYAGEPREE